ncbi:hypothetical protein INT43_002915 [Umbelopsis isabellina]|uniref:VPS4-associated protein 1 n=1 Tax=Mortierella isabellina TaxID=91625 RepID=A0A8H7U939_MORIS|nr:hypothetical protein INT43_002915 [Umbelopsis isabellina]
MKNHYVLKATAADRPCFVCSKFTTAVLTCSDNSNDDWFYVCKTHLTDSHFCTIIGGSSPRPSSPAVSPKPKPKTTDTKAESNSVSDLLTGIGTGIWNTWKGSPKADDKDDSKEKDDKSKERAEAAAPNPPVTPSPPPNQPKATAATYVLHRDFYYLREREVQKRRQKKEAAAKLHTMQFPEVPKTLPPSLAKPR